MKCSWASRGLSVVGEVALHRVTDHRIPLGEGVALRRDAAAIGIIPTRRLAAGLRAVRHLESNLHARPLFP